MEMNNAIGNIIDYYFRKEETDFVEEWLGENTFESKKVYLEQVKHQILYSLMFVRYNGNIERINEKFISYYDVYYGEVDDDEND